MVAALPSEGELSSSLISMLAQGSLQMGKSPSHLTSENTGEAFGSPQVVTSCPVPPVVASLEQQSLVLLQDQCKVRPGLFFQPNNQKSASSRFSLPGAGSRDTALGSS